MCRLFIGADSGQWASQAHSLRIDGVATSIRIEAFFWQVLEEIAFRDHMTVTQLITRLYHEAIDADHDMGNFTSFLRVCCGRYLSLIAAGEISGALGESLRDIDSTAVLSRESAQNMRRQQMFRSRDIARERAGRPS